MSTRSASGNPRSTRNGAPYCTIPMNRSHWSSTSKPSCNLNSSRMLARDPPNFRPGSS